MIRDNWIARVETLERNNDGPKARIGTRLK